MKSLKETAKLFAEKVAEDYSENAWGKYATSFQLVKECEKKFFASFDYQEVGFHCFADSIDKYTYEMDFDRSPTYRDFRVKIQTGSSDAHLIRMALLVKAKEELTEGLSLKK